MVGRQSTPGISAPDCPQCPFGALASSRAKSLWEEFREITGAKFYRCYGCQSRYISRFNRLATIANVERDNTAALVTAAIILGLLTCIIIALYAQKMAHRWPF